MIRENTAAKVAAFAGARGNGGVTTEGAGEEEQGKRTEEEPGGASPDLLSDGSREGRRSEGSIVFEDVQKWMSVLPQHIITGRPEILHKWTKKEIAESSRPLLGITAAVNVEHSNAEQNDEHDRAPTGNSVSSTTSGGEVK